VDGTLRRHDLAIDSSHPHFLAVGPAQHKIEIRRPPSDPPRRPPLSTKLGVAGGSPVAGVSTATLTSKGYSHIGSYNPDIHVTVSIDGFPSDPFGIFINYPLTMVTGAGTFGSCTEVRLPEPGYHNSVRHSIADLIGAPLAAITTTESFENDHYLGSWNSTSSNWAATPPVPSTWCPLGKSGCASFWDSSTSFSDFFAACGPLLRPNAVAYNPNGTNAVDDLTQKWWVGSPSGFSGACDQEDVLSYYLDHGKVSGIITPITNQSQCARGSVIN
jgi:hypothetical protein